MQHGGHVGDTGERPFGDGRVEGGFGVSAGGFDGLQAGGQAGARWRGGDPGSEARIDARTEPVPPGRFGVFAVEVLPDREQGAQALGLLHGGVAGFERR
jgi:hypothetical protein